MVRPWPRSCDHHLCHAPLFRLRPASRQRGAPLFFDHPIDVLTCAGSAYKCLACLELGCTCGVLDLWEHQHLTCCRHCLFRTDLAIEAFLGKPPPASVQGWEPLWKSWLTLGRFWEGTNHSSASAYGAEHNNTVELTASTTLRIFIDKA